jgi:inosine-uridine nucleoside N-ribohydrolase
MRKRVILDVDTGIDDAMAILLAASLPELKIEAITTVSGNSPINEVVKNTKTVLGLIPGGSEIPVGKGAVSALNHFRFHAPEVHGEDGLGNVRAQYDASEVSAYARPALSLIREVLERSAASVTIIATGPLTNIARGIRKYPRLMRKVREIISMGGAFERRGNTGPFAEFNYYVDPAAVRIVAESGIPFTILPLNVTERAILKRSEVREWARRYPNRYTTFLVDITRFYMRYHKSTESFYGGYLHDPMAVAIAAYPSLAKKVTHRFLIETNGTYTSGATMTRDAGGNERRAPVVRIVTDVNIARFKRLFKNTMCKFSGGA